MAELQTRSGIRDVARAAGVSIGTVSKVLRSPHDPGSHRISEATRDRVLEAARLLQYRANYGAQLLRGSGSRTIGFAIALPGEHYASFLSDYTIRLLNGLGAGAAEIGYQLLLINNADYEYFMDINRIDGLVIIAYSLRRNPHLAATERLYRHFNSRNYPYVVLNHTVNDPSDQIPFISSDNASGMRQIVDHIAARGYSSVGFVGELTANPQMHHDERVAWLRRYLVAAGIPCEDRQFVNGSGGGVPDIPREGEYSHADGYFGLKYLAEAGLLPRCLVCGNDTIVLGAMKYAREHGIRVPEELALIGYDDIPNAAYFNPALTTVRQPLEDFGRLAVDFIRRRIADPEIFETRTVEPQLIVRDSG